MRTDPGGILIELLPRACGHMPDRYIGACNA
jgi:hypothetical protein